MKAYIETIKISRELIPPSGIAPHLVRVFSPIPCSALLLEELGLPVVSEECEYKKQMDVYFLLQAGNSQFQTAISQSPVCFSLSFEAG